MTEDEMVGWHHRLNGHEFEQAPGVGEGQGGLVCCSPWGCKESDTAWQQSTQVMHELVALCEIGASHTIELKPDCNCFLTSCLPKHSCERVS